MSHVTYCNFRHCCPHPISTMHHYDITKKIFNGVPEIRGHMYDITIKVLVVTCKKMQQKLSAGYGVGKRYNGERSVKAPSIRDISNSGN